MKITLCSRKFKSPFVGGVDVYTNRLRQALQRLGHEVTILAVDSTKGSDNGSITVSSDEYDGTKISRLEFSFASRQKEAFDLAYDPEMGRSIRELLQAEQPDLFVILNFYIVTLASVEAAKCLGIPVVHVATDFLPVCRRATFVRWNGRSCQVGESIKSCAECFVSQRSLGRLAASVMNSFPQETLVRWAKQQENYRPPHPLGLLQPYWKQVVTMEQRLQILQPLREQIDLVLTPTQFTQRTFLENGFTSRQVHFLPFGVEKDHPLASVKHVPASNTRFLFVGRLQPYKGAHLLLKAFNNLAEPNDATLTIYGTADGYEDYYSQLHTAMAPNPRIHFGGRIDPEDLGKAFAEADYFVLPSTWHENCPLILLDALQSQTPVIASDIGGVTDVVRDGVNGLLFPMGDAQALQHAMQKAISQPTLVERLRAGVDLPDIDDYAETMIRLYQEKA
jgi:glycosyltransferase involved in cell wall biosynthesis